MNKWQEIYKNNLIKICQMLKNIIGKLQEELNKNLMMIFKQIEDIIINNFHFLNIFLYFSF